MLSNSIAKRFLVIIALFCFSAVCNAAVSAQKAVENSYYAWCSAIGTAKGDSSAIVKFYAPNAILLPTLSDKILFNSQGGGLSDYFKTLTSYQNIKCTPKQLITQMYGDIAINSGVYTFSYQDARGQHVQLPARFTFVYKEFGPQWLIVNHHSSNVP